MTGGHLWQVVAYERWSLIRGGRLWEMVTYDRWSLMTGGRLWEMVAYERWSLMRDGHLWQVVAYERWSLMTGGHLWEVVIYERWSLMRGGCRWRFDCKFLGVEPMDSWGINPARGQGGPLNCKHRALTIKSSCLLSFWRNKHFPLLNNFITVVVERVLANLEIVNNY